ncbi:hypothetical protein CRYUN_Cryun03dG0167900 [Craigia yunnanensis]
MHSLTSGRPENSDQNSPNMGKHSIVSHLYCNSVQHDSSPSSSNGPSPWTQFQDPCWIYHSRGLNLLSHLYCPVGSVSIPHLAEADWPVVNTLATNRNRPCVQYTKHGNISPGGIKKAKNSP